MIPGMADQPFHIRAAKLAFWGSSAALVHTHVTYPLALAAIERLRGPRPEARPAAP